MTTSPFTELFQKAVKAAYELNASDIHIEPTRTGVDIRLRVFGEMQAPWKQLGLEHKTSFISAVKAETKLAIGVSGRAQDSRCSIDGLPIDLRVSLLPTLFGETIVLRLLDSSREFGIDKLMVPKSTLSGLMQSIEYPSGVVLISGPTGSGKTTTLYSLLCKIDRTRKKIITLEDPVEYVIHGISQVRVGPKVSFADALRAVLRQDPDVILVGEIRDEETASLAFRAAATGHLVLSTVHANSAADVIGRLENLGIDRDSLRDNLRFSAAQRLVPKLCRSCSKPATMATICRVGEAAGFSFDHTDSLRMRATEGCSDCQAGVIGRLPVIEYIKQADIERHARGETSKPVATLSLADAALELAVAGLIDVREVMNVG